MNNIVKNEILALHGVSKTDDIDFKKEARFRIDYLKDYLKSSKLNGYVLGISGGVDSTTAGKLCQLACSELQNEGYAAYFYAVRLPYGEQADENDAQTALTFIDPDYRITVGIELATNSIHSQLTGLSSDRGSLDFHKGNVKARMRMLAQYEIAGLRNCLVVGTDHNSELVPAFYTKWGDQACDIVVLNGLSKRQVRKLAEAIGVPEKLYLKTPTADLEEIRPQLADEVALGFLYDDLDDFLEGKSVSDEVVAKIVAQYEKTRHKRNWPVAFSH
jgi:NAD+ synthase